jgi:hypothetical protein
MVELVADNCGPSCTKTVRAVAFCRGGPGSVVVCITCGAAHTKNHGLSEEEITVIVETARAINKGKGVARLTTPIRRR